MRVSAKLTFQTAATLAILAAALFLPAGTLRIPEFWLYLAINAAVMAGSLLWLPPDLLEERARPGGKPMGARLYSRGAGPVHALGRRGAGPPVPLD